MLAEELAVLLRVAGSEDEQSWRQASLPAGEPGFQPGGIGLRWCRILGIS